MRRADLAARVWLARIRVRSGVALWWRRRKGGNGGGVEPWEWKGSNNGHSAVAGRQEEARFERGGLICKFGLCKGVLLVWGSFLHLRTSKLYNFWSGQIE